MSVLARRSKLLMWFDGVNISDDIAPYFLTATYTDNDDGVSDDLQVTLQDRDKIWMKSWLNEMVNAAAGDALKIRAKIWINYWNGYDVEEFLDCGEFELDSVSLSGPPNTVTIKACSLPFTSQIRQTKKSKAWENYSLSAILAEIAGANGMGYFFDTPNDPFYDRVEQSKTSDITFLQRLCTNAGLNIKATKGKLVIYDQSDYEQRPIVIEADYRDTSFTKWKLDTKTADTKYASCRVSYAKYRVGNTYIKTDLSDVAVLPNGTVRAQLTISAESTPLTVTRVELYNSDNALWAHQDCSITVNTGQTGILYWFDFTVTEQEVK